MRLFNFINFARSLYLLHEHSVMEFMSYLMIATAVGVSIMLYFISAPYGRYSASSWGPLINARLAWFIQEIPSFLVPVAIYFVTLDDEENFVGRILLSFFVIHYAYRSIIYSLLINGGKPTPLLAFFLAFVFCTYNGFMQARQLLVVSTYPSDWFFRPTVLLGMLMFITGISINIHSDRILRNLRKPGETDYKIPSGGVFNLISGANFFGEILEWCGYAVMCQTLPAFAFAFFTISNLGPRAMHHHRWYKKKFDNYPKYRKAVIPFIL